MINQSGGQVMKTRTRTFLEHRSTFCGEDRLSLCITTRKRHYLLRHIFQLISSFRSSSTGRILFCFKPNDTAALWTALLPPRTTRSRTGGNSRGFLNNCPGGSASWWIQQETHLKNLQTQKHWALSKPLISKLMGTLMCP